MYTSKQAQKENHSIVQSDEKRGGYGVENGERLLFENDDTRGRVCMKLLNDTPGGVDKHKGNQMGVRRDEKALKYQGFLRIDRKGCA